ncbi:hypothetical protein A2U01_0101684, partial [Trifolium medium]|nr:hypothetical protein [Trifolium medium]
AQMTEAPNLLSTCWRDAPSYQRGAQLTDTSPNLFSIMAQRATSPCATRR